MPMFAFYKNWMEFFFAAFMVLGIFIAIAAPSAVISYAIIFVSGMFAGRILYDVRFKIRFPYIVIIAGFVLGYLLGAYYGNRKMLAVLFIAGAVLSYKLYDKKVLRGIRF